MKVSAVAGIELPRGSCDSACLCGLLPRVYVRDRRERADYNIVLQAFRSVLCIVFAFKCGTCVEGYGL
jgi:hypothetical protein